MSEFLPVTHEEMKARGWEQADFVYITGDAYVDHPSFGAAIITRTLEAYGYKVCIISQPNWKEVEEFRRFGKPRLGFLISSGNIDSMVNHYSVSKLLMGKWENVLTVQLLFILIWHVKLIQMFRLL